MCIIDWKPQRGWIAILTFATPRERPPKKGSRAYALNVPGKPWPCVLKHPDYREKGYFDNGTPCWFYNWSRLGIKNYGTTLSQSLITELHCASPDYGWCRQRPNMMVSRKYTALPASKGNPLACGCEKHQHTKNLSQYTAIQGLGLRRQA